MDESKDDEKPSNTLELFIELDQVLEMITDLKVCHISNFEKEYEKFNEILSRYQEQPHLLDPHLDTLISNLLNLIHDSNGEECLVHGCFKYLYTITKVRTYKALVKFMPHELSDLEFALDLLEKQDIRDSDHWETRYMLLLWMSILVLNPFHMARLDAYPQGNENNAINDIQVKPKMERIFELCKLYSEQNDTCSSVAAFLSAKYFIRMDIKDIYLEKFFNWIMEQNKADTIDAKFGQLAAIAAILKIGKREDLLPYADTLFKWILSCNYKNDSDFLKYKYYIKIIQRIGLVYLKPRIAAWRYKRGKRSLALNLLQTEAKEVAASDGKKEVENEANDEETDFVCPESIEEVIEELLQGLRSASSDIRWSAAKGLGRVTNRLPKTLADEVIGSVIELFNPLETNEAWHGACLASAELAKRGLLLPYRLTTMVPLLLQALFYDEMKGYMSVGQHIRDSACYMCWAFARAYDPIDLQPFVNEIAAGLLTVAVFDREINCRRAASAAFQESVGRLGNFPYGIEISTMTDFFSVGMRQNTYLNISVFIAQYDEYKEPLINHLIEKKIMHWDAIIRELSAKALHNLTAKAPDYMAVSVLPKLFANTDSIEVNLRHGSILAIGEIIYALKLIEKEEPNKTLLSNKLITDLNELIGKLIKRDIFRGMSGEIMKECCTNFIHNCSKGQIEVQEQCIEDWQLIIDKCLPNKTFKIREAATLALRSLCISYYDKPERLSQNMEIINTYINDANTDFEEHIRMGYLSALGVLPKFMILPKLEEVIANLIRHSLPPQGALQALIHGDQNAKLKQNENSITIIWSEARKESVKSLSNVVQTVGFQSEKSIVIFLDNVFSCFLKALEEYTLDNRGDIGAWVREAAMIALFQLLTTCPENLLKPKTVHSIMASFAQQAVEKIDRTRGLAGKLFCNLIHWNPQIPHIVEHSKLKEIFPEDSSKVLWLFADHTFQYFCSMLIFPEYSSRIVLGLSASIGQLTESLIKYSSAALFQFLRSHPDEVQRICEEIIYIFEENSMNERVTYPMLNFLDILLSSGTVNGPLLNETSTFPDEILRLVNIEIKGHKKLYKLTSSINVYCQLIQVPRLFKKVLLKISIFLGLTHVHIRKTTATKLYETLALHGDECDIPEENLEEILNLLSETDWGMPLTEVRPVRNKLCVLLGIQPPISLAAITSGTQNVTSGTVNVTPI